MEASAPLIVPAAVPAAVPATAPLYAPRRAIETPLWALVNEHAERIRRVWPERFEPRYGPWQERWQRVMEHYLECGDLECGFARVRCSDCGSEYLLPFSCKLRNFCPTCDARRRVEWADHLLEHVLPDVGYRQLVFTVPKVLRHTFMRERALLGEMTRTAWCSTRTFLAAQFPGLEDPVPYFVSAVHTFGSWGNLHPHVHVLCSEGVLDRQRQYHPLPEGFDWTPLAELFRHVVLEMLVRRERLQESTRQKLLIDICTSNAIQYGYPWWRILICDLMVHQKLLRNGADERSSSCEFSRRLAPAPVFRP